MICWHAVKSEELKWLPNGSELLLGTEKSASGSTSKPKTYTSFTSSQDSLPELSKNPICPTYPDITIARLGSGQVSFWSITFLYVISRYQL